jgi:hypothetical protein
MASKSDKERYIAENSEYSFNEDLFTFSLVDASTVDRLRRDGDIKLPPKKVNVPKDERWNTKQMTSKLMQGILNGDSIPKISESLLDVVHNNDVSATRAARTLVTQAENHGRLDSYKTLDEQGVVQEKVWIATPDSRTRASHLDVDGERVGINDTFSNGLEYPADPSGEPEEVYNCRCSMRTEIVGFRQADGSISRVDYERDDTMHEGQMEAEKERRAVTFEKSIANVPDGFLNKDNVLDSLEKLSSYEKSAWNEFINETDYKYIDNDSDGAYYSPEENKVYLFDYSSEDTFFHETAHAIDDGCIEGSIEISGERKVIGSDEWRPMKGYTEKVDSASAAAQEIYNFNETAWSDDQKAFMKWAGMKDEDDIESLIHAVSEFRNKYGIDAASTLGDLIDAQTIGKYPMTIFAGGHGADYWASDYKHITREAWAEISALKAAGQDEIVDALTKILPNRVSSQVTVYNIVFKGAKAYEHEVVTKNNYSISRQVWRFGRKS